MDRPDQKVMLAELTSLLTKGNAHATFEDACAGLMPDIWNRHVPEVPYTIWQLVEHVRIAQWDIVEFCFEPKHESPKWPDGYWPAPDATADEEQWQETLDHIRQNRQRFLHLIHAPGTDLLAKIPHGDGQTLLREAMLIADHNAYHTGEIILIRRLLKAWK
ncbi:DinB family protein [Hymenobacter properus]|uniref:DinB family protein n=1 Tax=Hymenobacter properus TaxID=2791026 RepID=A0A931FMF6_9BACT|nr:DinB family protein [Hymenobacter properus]MBF9143056.1 DinB family protein [Hymenobacter properus]MBR7721864.1 DinB family protein [Microvirga sp. SRT04]